MTKKYGVEIAILSVQIQTSALIWFAGRQLLKKKPSLSNSEQN